MLNYDQFLELDAIDGSKIKSIDRQIVKEATQCKAFEGTGYISDDMKMYAIDIIFKKKWKIYNEFMKPENYIYSRFILWIQT